MNILVTGGAGFIGSNFIRLYLDRNPEDKIINLDNLTYAGNLESLKDVSNNPNYKFVRGDICNDKLVNKLIKGIDLIVHFAAESHVDRSIASSAPFIRTNVEGTRVLLDAALKVGKIRFHHVSTDEVFGHLKLEDPPFDENTPYNPRSPYSASKAASDHLVRAYFYTHNLPITISNCVNNYGPYQFPEKLIPLFATNLMEDKKVSIYGKGNQIRSWIHVDDHNKGVEVIIKKGKIGETYFLGGDEFSNLDITKKVLELMDRGEDSIEYVEDRLGHDFRYAMDSSKIERELGFRREIEFEKGLKDTINWYKENKQWWKPLKKYLYENQKSKKNN